MAHAQGPGHLSGLLQSLFVILFLTGLAAIVMIRPLRRDLQRTIDREEFQVFFFLFIFSLLL
jgi:hypothetical protein